MKDPRLEKLDDLPVNYSVSISDREFIAKGRAFPWANYER